MNWRRCFRLFPLIRSLLIRQSEGRAQAREIRIAAAADLKFAMGELSAQFERQAGTKVNVTYGSSGNFFSQMQNGAPFDLFFSADIEYPQKLEAAGLAEPGTLYEYAVGRIGLWMPPASIVQGAIILKNAMNKDAAQAFLEFVKSKAGREILERYGFAFTGSGLLSTSH